MFMAGEITEAMPIVNLRTITVSPFAGKTNVAPEKGYNRLEQFCPSRNQMDLQIMYANGYRDTEKWIRSMCASEMLHPGVLKN
jgi:hypothetical protein